MRVGHERFDALAGAVMLGEATPAERVTFDEHARVCETCRDDLAYATTATQALETARDCESWRPSVASPILERIASTRGRRRERTIGAFGWAIALSFVANVAFASGITSGSFAAFRHVGEAPSEVTATTIHFERAVPKASSSRVGMSAASPRRIARHPHARPPSNDMVRKIARANAAAPKISPRAIDDLDAGAAPNATSPTAAVAALANEPGALAGLGVEPGVTKAVAIEPSACERRGERERELVRGIAEACPAPATPLAH